MSREGSYDPPDLWVDAEEEYRDLPGKSSKDDGLGRRGGRGRAQKGKEPDDLHSQNPFDISVLNEDTGYNGRTVRRQRQQGVRPDTIEVINNNDQEFGDGGPRYQRQGGGNQGDQGQQQDCCLAGLKSCLNITGNECLADCCRSSIIPAIILIIEIVVCIAFVVNAHTKTDPNKFNLGDSDVEYLLVAYMIASLVCFIFFYCVRKDENYITFLGDEERSSKYLVAGIYAFGGGSLFMAVFYLFAYVHCAERSSHVVFYVFLLFFIFAQMLFLEKFNQATLSRYALSVIMLFHIMATNFSIWLYYIVEESHFLPTEDNDTEHKQCLAASNVTGLLDDWQEYMTPFILEFSIISLGMTYSIISSMRSLNAGYQSIAGSSVTASMNRVDEARETETYPTFFIGLAVSVCMVVSSLVVKQRHDFPQSLIFHHVMIMLVSITQIYYLFRMLFEIRKFPPRLKAKVLKADDYLLMAAYTGIVLWNIFCIIASASGFHYKKTHDAVDSQLVGWVTGVSVAVFFDNFACLLQTTLQAWVIYRAMRYARGIADRMLLERNARKVLSDVRYYAVYILMTNVGFWILDSFFELRNTSVYYPVADEFYYNNWKIFSSLLYPLNIIFRFHSAALLFEIFTRYYYVPPDEQTGSIQSGPPSVNTI